MSDMEVREIPAAGLEAVIQEPSLDELVKELEVEFASQKTGGKKPKKAGRSEIVFEGPTDAEKAKEDRINNEKATPLIDAAARPRWIPTRECWCPSSAQTDCRFHSQEEKGWEECPNKPANAKLGIGHVTAPRRLYGTNPDFGKPLDPVVAEESVAEAA